MTRPRALQFALQPWFIGVAALVAATALPPIAPADDAAPATPPDQPQAVVMNPGWEHGGVPWKFRVSNFPMTTRPGVGRFGAFEGFIESGAARSGEKGYVIRGDENAGEALAILDNELRGLVPGRMYRTNIWIRGKGVGEAFLKVGTADSQAARQLPGGTYDWQEVSLDWTAGEGERTAPVVIVVKGPVTELAIDDVSVGLSPLQEPTLGTPEAAPNVDIDAPAVRLPRGRFDVLENAEGQFLQPQGEGTGGVLRMRMDGPASMQIGQVRVPLDATDGARKVPFTIPLAGLPDGEYTIHATLDNKPAATATFQRVNIDTGLKDEVKAFREEIDQVRADAEAADVADDPYINMGLVLMDRFATRIETGGPDRNQNRHWSRLQLEEMREVLADVRADIEQRKTGPALPGVVKRPTDERLKIEGGRVMMPATPVDSDSDSASGERVTYFPMGFGHFIKVRRDIPNHWTWGATIIQQGNGPNLLEKDGSLPEDTGGILPMIEDAEQARMKVDFLAGPGIPNWVMAGKTLESDPDLYVRNVGFIPQNIDHPLHREWSEKWLRTILPEIKDSPAVSSICLSNEPAYA